MSEPTKVYILPAGTALPFVDEHGRPDVAGALKPFRVVSEHDYAKLAQALTLATQRAEAAEADLREVIAALGCEREDGVWWLPGDPSPAQCKTLADVVRRTHRQADYDVKRAEAERDALRKDAAQAGEYSSEWLRGLLREMIALSSVRRIAQQCNVSPALLHGFVSGKVNECPPKLSAALGYARRVTYALRAALAVQP